MSAPDNEANEALDMRVFVPIQRHEKLLKLFKELPVGSSFVFINDHDPIPLYYEFRSIHGDVVGWEYLERGGEDWKVRVTRAGESEARDLKDAATTLDLRNADRSEWKKIVFHRFGMMEEGTIMELIAAGDPVEIREIFQGKFRAGHEWAVQQGTPGEYVVHIKKTGGQGAFSIVRTMDFRPHPPALRHEMFYEAFAAIRPGEAFEFINDHDPKPLYYQMEAESREPFRWEYLESGPDDWKVRVGKVAVGGADSEGDS